MNDKNLVSLEIIAVIAVAALHLSRGTWSRGTWSNKGEAHPRSIFSLVESPIPLRDLDLVASERNLVATVAKVRIYTPVLNTRADEGFL
jgi:hypothetical protein